MNNRQNNRRRSRAPNPRQSGGGRGADPQNRIDNRTRGNAVQLHEKYRNMARDAQTKGDRVEAEYWWQFADHYYRVVADQRARAEERSGGGRSQRDEWRQQAEDDDDRGPQASGGRDSSDEDEGDDWRADARGRTKSQDGGRDVRSDGGRGGGSDDGRTGTRHGRGDGRADGRDADADRVRSDSREDRRDTNRPPRGRSDGDGSNGRGSEPNGADQDRSERVQMDRGQADGAEGDDQPNEPVQRRAPVRPQPADADADDTKPVTRPRRGRPRKNAAVEASDGQPDGAGEGLDSGTLPPSLTAAAAGDAGPPKRRGRPRKVVPEEGTEAA